MPTTMMSKSSDHRTRETSTTRLLLNPDAVRERAKSVPGCKEVVTYSESCVSFMVGLHQPGNVDELARINIFVDTGTVGTCRVLGGKMRQTFRRNIKDLDTIERLLKKPDQLTKIDESLIGMDDDDIERSKNWKNNGGGGGGVTGLLGSFGQQPQQPSQEMRRAESPRSLKKELELADVGLCILQGEKEKLTSHMEYLAEVAKGSNKVVASGGNKPSLSSGAVGIMSNKNRSTPKAAGAEETNQHSSHVDLEDDDFSASVDDDDDGSASSSVAGMEFRFSLPADVMAQVDQCLKDITRMDKLVKGVATNGKGTVFLYGNGGVAYTPSIPRALYQKLRQLRHSSYSARPCYISLGTRDRYFVSFHDGTADWKGPKALDKILKKCISSGEQPRSVAFGSSYDTFFIVFSDGSWQYQGRGIPESLEEKLASRDDRADLMAVNLGPSGEWFLKAKNGRMWWSGITDELDTVIGSILKANHFLHFLDFGESGSYFVSYDE